LRHRAVFGNLAGGGVMPELVEVEIITRNARRWAVGRRVVGVEVADSRLGLARHPDALEGATILGATRRAKQLRMETDRGVLLWHFGMTGHLVRGLDDRAARARLDLDNGTVLRFLDVRRLGSLALVSPDEMRAADDAQALGPEPFPDPLPADVWRARLGGSRRPIKHALMDQSAVAGLGNIAAVEILFAAGVHPLRSACGLEVSHWAALAAAAHAWLHARVRADEGDEIRYVSEGGENPFAVYRREGAPCVRCGSAIARAVVAGRSTFWCPGCQPEA
jgi:formamidopyrimidine-DNA glycosylase